MTSWSASCGSARAEGLPCARDLALLLFALLLLLLLLLEPPSL
jgi:hypothetical protein